MGFPTVSQGRVDQRLTNVLLAYTNENYYADKFFPIVGGLKDDSGYVPKMGKQHLRTYSTKRALYDRSSHEIKFTIDTDDTYKIDYYDLESFVPDRIKDQFRAPFDALNAAQITTLEAMKLDRDIAAAAALTDTSILTNYVTLSGTSQFSDHVNSDPLGKIKTACQTIFGKIGRMPNRMSIEHRVLDELAMHPQIREVAMAKIAGGVPATAALDGSSVINVIKAQFPWIKEVVVPMGIKITSQEGQTETIGEVWNKDIVVYYTPDSPTLMAPSFGYSFQLQNQNMRSVVRRDAVSDKGDIVETDWAYQDKILDANSAYLIKSAIA